VPHNSASSKVNRFNALLIQLVCKEGPNDYTLIYYCTACVLSLYCIVYCYHLLCLSHFQSLCTRTGPTICAADSPADVSQAGTRLLWEKDDTTEDKVDAVQEPIVNYRHVDIMCGNQSVMRVNSGEYCTMAWWQTQHAEPHFPMWLRWCARCWLFQPLS